jgi:hypothetical protein
VTSELATAALASRSRLGNGKLGAEVRSGDGSGLLAQVKLVEVGGRAVAVEVDGAFRALVVDERIVVSRS